MFEITVEATFSAAHAITVRARREPLHGHDWHVTAAIRGAALDADGLLADFHGVERALREIVAPFHNRTLNDVPPFDRVNPSAEQVARHVGQRLAGALEGVLPAGARVASVRVTEAPGCAATWSA